MSAEDEHLCRLCLKVAKGELFEIDENISQMFEILSLKLDLGITRNPIICLDCMEVSKKCLDFKYTCIHSEQFILSYSADRKKIRFDIKVIYEKRERVRTALDEDFSICRLCMTRLESNTFTSLDVSMNESMFEMLSAYMVEMDFNIIENPLVCADCQENLGGYFNFLLSCQDIEEMIKAYCKEKGTDTIGQVKLGNVLLFRFTDVMEYPDECSQTSKTKQDHSVCVYPEAYARLIKQEEVDIKDEEIILDETSYIYTSEIRVDQNGDSYQSKECDKETKPDMTCLNSRENKRRVLKKNVTSCKVGSGPKQKHKVVKYRPILKDTPDLQSYISLDSGICPMYKCSLCTYEAKQKRYLNRHMLRHKDTSEIKMYKCSLCTYEAKQKNYLTRHMLAHKDVSEIKMYKCSLCTYEAKHKRYLNFHMLVHKDASEIKLYKCSLCTYEAKQNRYLIRHNTFVHKDVSEIKMYKCSLCSYEAKQKSCLTRHMLAHKDVSEIQMYKCSSCTYETRDKSHLIRHMLVHKDVSEINMFKCSLCAYEAKHKCSLISHMLVHKDASKIKMFKCSLCAYEAKQKGSLNLHMLVHKDPSEIKMFKCSLCTYKAKHKSNLTSHMLVHKDISEIKLYKCSFCTYEGKRKRDLKNHILGHKGIY